MTELTVRNRQRKYPLNLPLVRRLAQALLSRTAPGRPGEIGFHIVAAPKMATLNRLHLRHAGSTDVITFPYGPPRGPSPLLGDVFVCLDEAFSQARRFRTTWQSELVRYFVHGLLHLLGHDDLNPSARRRMKREEDRLVRLLERAFPIKALGRPPRVSEPARKRAGHSRPRLAFRKTRKKGSAPPALAGRGRPR